MIEEDRLVKTLQDLVRIPSHESMEAISSHIASEVRKAGLKPEADKDGNVIARLGTGQALLLNAHMDTVGVDSYPDAFSGEVRGDKLYGRGSTDDKSGVAAMLELMRALQKDPPKKQVIFAFTVWEEGGDRETRGAHKVLDRVEATHAITLESAVSEDGRMSIDIGCKGRFVYMIDVLGNATHSGRPQQGKNAIYMASKLIEKLSHLKTPSEKTPKGDDIMSFLNVTQIEAKEGSNVIPGKCTLTVDYRALPTEKEKDAKSRIERACRDVLGESFRLSDFTEPKAGYLKIDEDFIDVAKAGIQEAGYNPYTQLSSGWFDGAVFHGGGIATLNVGPGTRGQAHKNPEYCWIPGLVNGTRAVLNIIRRWDLL